MKAAPASREDGRRARARREARHGRGRAARHRVRPRDPGRVLVWCGGAHADPDAVEWGLEFDNSGRLVVDAGLKAQGHDDIYVVGDVAAFRDPEDNRVLPMLAQFAIREAEHAADNILARRAARRPSRSSRTCTASS